MTPFRMKKIKRHPAFIALKEPHKRVHAHGIEAARLYNDGDTNGSLSEIKKVGEASTEVLDLLDELAER